MSWSPSVHSIDSLADAILSLSLPDYAYVMAEIRQRLHNPEDPPESVGTREPRRPIEPVLVSAGRLVD